MPTHILISQNEPRERLGRFFIVIKVFCKLKDCRCNVIKLESSIPKSQSKRAFPVQVEASRELEGRDFVLRAGAALALTLQSSSRKELVDSTNIIIHLGSDVEFRPVVQLLGHGLSKDFIAT